MPFPTDPAQAVLRDFENIIWLTILVGLVLAVVFRLISSRSQKRRREEAEGGLVASEIAAPRLEAGIAVSHFNGADLFFLPLVLIKYSITLQLIAGELFTFPGKLAKSTGLVSADEAAESVEKAAPVAPDMSVQLIGLDMAFNLLLIGLVLTMIFWVGERDVGKVLGLHRFRGMEFPSRILWPAIWILGGALISTPIVFFTSQQMPDLLSGLFGEEVEEQAAVQNIRENSEMTLRILLILNACIVAPIVEELVFRGYFYGIMKRYTGAMFAAFVTSAIFAVAHQNLLALLPLWGFALFLTFFYESSRCLWVPIGIHALFNMVNVVFILMGMGGDAPIDGGG